MKFVSLIIFLTFLGVTIKAQEFSESQQTEEADLSTIPAGTEEPAERSFDPLAFISDLSASNITVEDVVSALNSAKNLTSMIDNMKASAMADYRKKMEEAEYFKAVFLSLIIIVIIVLFFNVCATVFIFVKLHRLKKKTLAKPLTPNF